VKRIPIVPTLIVVLACAAMIGLGFWQLQRLDQKEALLKLYRANLSRPAISLPTMGPVPTESLFRRTSANCVRIEQWHSEAGQSQDGGGGFRWIAQCSTGAEGLGLIVDMGVTRALIARPDWTGGEVSGLITTEPDHGSLIASLFGKRSVLRPMIVSDSAAPGLKPSAKPNPDDIPNNHLAYAIQWFIFAAIAALIYGLALRRQNRN
jgi:surfeit locus 1 family protein